MFTITVFGGTGFFGRRLVRRLVAEGAAVRVAVRHDERARNVLHADGLDHVAVFRADVRDTNSLVAALAGADAIVNSVSGYVEQGDATFEATIVRPGAMVGPGDALFGTLADLARFLPVLPLIGGGGTRLQPVCVDDVVEAVCRILVDPGTVGRTYELAGPKTYTVRELVMFTLWLIGKRRLLMTVPFAMAKVLALLFEFLPSPPLTTSQVDLLKTDNVASGTLPGFQELSIQPEVVEEVVPTYIGRSHMPEPH